MLYLIQSIGNPPNLWSHLWSKDVALVGLHVTVHHVISWPLMSRPSTYHPHSLTQNLASDQGRLKIDLKNLINMFFENKLHFQLIHEADPQSRAGSDHCFAYAVRSYVRPHFTKQNKTNFNNVRYWWDCGSGRVDHWWHLSCLVYVEACWNEIGKPPGSHKIHTYLTQTILWFKNNRLDFCILLRSSAVTGCEVLLCTTRSLLVRETWQKSYGKLSRVKRNWFGIFSSP